MDQRNQNIVESVNRQRVPANLFNSINNLCFQSNLSVINNNHQLINMCRSIPSRHIFNNNRYNFNRPFYPLLNNYWPLYESQFSILQFLSNNFNNPSISLQQSLSITDPINTFIFALLYLEFLSQLAHLNTVNDQHRSI